MIDIKTGVTEPVKWPGTDKTKYVDLKKELSEVRDLLREMLSAVPAQKEYVELRNGLTEVKILLEKQVETEGLLRGMNAEWRAVTDRVIQNLGDAKKESLEFKRIYTEVLEKEIRLIARIREDINANGERLLRQIMELATNIERAPSIGWKDLAKQYGAQMAITIGLIATVVGTYHVVAFLIRLFV